MAKRHQNHPKCILTIKNYAQEHTKYFKLFRNFPSRKKCNYNSLVMTSVLKISVSTNTGGEMNTHSSYPTYYTVVI
jgi:hypothetical protein